VLFHFSYKVIQSHSLCFFSFVIEQCTTCGPEHGPPLLVLSNHNWGWGPCFAGSAKSGNPHPGNWDPGRNKNCSWHRNNCGWEKFWCKSCWWSADNGRGNSASYPFSICINHHRGAHLGFYTTAAVYISTAYGTILTLIALHHAIIAKFGSTTRRSFDQTWSVQCLLPSQK